MGYGHEPTRAETILSLSAHYRYRNQPRCIDTAADRIVPALDPTNTMHTEVTFDLIIYLPWINLAILL